MTYHTPKKGRTSFRHLDANLSRPLVAALLTGIDAVAVAGMIAVAVLIASVIGWARHDDGLAAPPAFHGPLAEFGSLCGGLSANLLDAQLDVASGFVAHQISAAGSTGYAQMTPAMWAAYGDGGDPNVPRDAVRAQAKYDCAMLTIANVRGCTGDQAIKVMLAMYNAGPGGVTGCEVPVNGETESYVAQVIEKAGTR